MSDAGEERVSQADRPGDQPITLHEIGEAPPSELFDKGKNSLLKWLEEHPLIRWIAILSVIVGAVFSIFIFFTGANRCAVQPAAGDERLAIVADFNQGGVVTGARIYNSLADQLAEDGSTNVRLAWVAGVAPRTREQAQRIGETCRATMVIWGVADGAGVPVQYEVGSPRTVGQGLKSSELYVREDAPLEYTYLVSFTLGRIEYLAQDFDASLVWFDQSVGVVEGMSEAQQRALAASLLYNYRGLLYYKQGGYEQSIADYNRAIELDLESVAAYVNRGNSYDDMGEYELAVADYNRAIELDPDEAGAYVNRGLAYSYQGSLGPAIADYDRAIELDPTFAGAYFSRGLAYYYQGNLEQAIAEFSRAIELDPEYEAAYYNRGIVHGELNEYEQAIADYSRAVELDPQDAEAYNNRGLIYANVDEHGHAFADYNRAIGLDPEFAMAYNNRGFVYQLLGEKEKAIADYDRAIELDSEYAEAYDNRGIIYRIQGEFEQAIADYSRAIELDPEYAMAYINRGHLYENMGNLEAALSDYRTALELAQGSYPDYQEWQEWVEARIAEIEVELESR